MEEMQIKALDWGDVERVHAARALVVAAFDKPERYGPERVAQEVHPANEPFYRHFFVAIQADRVLGVAGVKAADWATNTHVLYLSAVAKEFRGEGIGRALVLARLDWLQARFPGGRVLVSTAKPSRFKRLGFRVVTGSRKEGRWLMLKEMG